MKPLWLIAIASACGRHGFEERLDAPPRCTQAFAACPQTAAGPPLEVSTTSIIDTDRDPRCMMTAQIDGPSLCTLHVETISITSSGVLRATGSRPLLLVSDGDVVIDGMIDVSSRAGAQHGAGASWPSSICVPARPPDKNSGGGGGAAGGSFGGTGGPGGSGNADGLIAVAGVANATELRPAVIRAGCLGVSGGPDCDDATAGASGAGGGALYLVARGDHAIEVTGVIAAGGAGGGGGTATVSCGGAGGGGGGSGGMIVLEAARIEIAASAKLAANGGGGGGGSMGWWGADGANGLAQAAGGSAGIAGSRGGSGAASGLLDGESAGPLPPGGGGGGGGSVGIIELIAGTIAVTGVISPPPTSRP